MSHGDENSALKVQSSNVQAKNIQWITNILMTHNYYFSFIVFGTLHRFWKSLRHFSTEMAEIWCPGTSFQDDWTHKISALYLLYFLSLEMLIPLYIGESNLLHNIYWIKWCFHMKSQHALQQLCPLVTIFTLDCCQEINFSIWSTWPRAKVDISSNL